MNPNVLVLAELKNDAPDNITYELLTKGRSLADAKGGQLAVLVIGQGTESAHQALSESAADKVLVCDAPVLKAYNAEIYASVIADAIADTDPGLVLCGYTYFGIEIGTLAAAKANREVVSNCVDLTWSDDVLTASRNVYGATLRADVQLDTGRTYLVSFERGALPKQIEAFSPAVVETRDVTVDEATVRTQVVEVIKQAAGEIDITQASILCSVGRGIGDKDKIQLIQDLADALGGVVSCSRPVADMGWLPATQQVGISANYVTPDVYIACGISGASQHVAAMRDAGTIIAINKDPNAPIFRVAHYGIVGDLFDVVPAMIEQARQ